VLKVETINLPNALASSNQSERLSESEKPLSRWSSYTVQRKTGTHCRQVQYVPVAIAEANGISSNP
jgi:hypothetical protein